VVKTSIVFPDQMYEKMKELADERGIPISSIVKTACSEYVKKENNNK
jgi:predicted DNA-binding protein